MTLCARPEAGGFAEKGGRREERKEGRKERAWAAGREGKQAGAGSKVVRLRRRTGHRSDRVDELWCWVEANRAYTDDLNDVTSIRSEREMSGYDHAYEGFQDSNSSTINTFAGGCTADDEYRRGAREYRVDMTYTV